MDSQPATRSDSVYLLNASSHEPARPSGMQNLQKIFGLDDLAASVARFDAQGNKIVANKLNKTYKKQLLDLGVPGAIEIPRSTFIMDLLMSGAAHQEFNGYQHFSNAEFTESFNLRPGILNGYVKYRPPSPTLKRVKQESPITVRSPGISPPPGVPAVTQSHRASRRPTLSPVQTRSSTAPQSTVVEDLDGDESSDDGSRFKELERERKKKLRMKRDAELAMGGDFKRRRYDVDGYEFLDSD